MKGKGIKVFGVIMSLLLVFSFAATFSISSTSVVSAGTQKWTKISIPDTDDNQLAQGSDIGVISVSPDGGTLFATVYNHPDYLAEWQVFKSTDGGYKWKATGYNVDADVVPADQIVDMDVSPAWVDDTIVVVATVNDAYYSEDGGNTWDSMSVGTDKNGDAMGTVSSMDIELDSDGDATYVIGTSVDVYILQGFGGWSPQLVDYGYTAFNGVFDVSFSPNYGEDGVVFALIKGRPSVLDNPNGTHLRAESDIEVNNWGSYIQDAHFMDQTGDVINSDSGCMTFADDYNSAPAVFVGLTSYNLADPIETARGDAFRVDLVSGTIGTSAVTDLNIRGVDTRTNVVSIAVSGDSQSAFILAGLRDLGNAAQMTTWKGQVHYSSNGGESWLQCYKPPSGMTGGSTAAPMVEMAPDFSESGIAYCGNGFIAAGTPTAFSGFFASTTEGTTWTGRGLLDHSINEIYDIVPSPDYDTDSTLFMVTRDLDCPIPTYNMGLLWETKDGGSTWDLILGMTLMIPLPGVSINAIEIPATYPDEPSVFVTGPLDVNPFPPQLATALIARSTDEGNLFATTLKAPYLAGVPQVVAAWKVIDKETLLVASGYRVWKTTDMGAHWDVMDASSDIQTTENVIDMQIFNDTTVIVGTDDGNVYMCQNWETDFSFTQVDAGPGVAGDEVHVSFDTNYDDTGMIYAGVDSGGAFTGGIWRIDANGGDAWEQIWFSEDILSIGCDGNGILWAISDDGVWSCAVREVNPTAPIDDIDPEYVLTGLTSDLWTDLETAPTQTYVFAIGGAGNTELWAYIDTLIKPTLISPANGATAAGTILQGNAMALLSLRWEEMPKATMYEYQVAYDTEFGSIAVSDDTVEGTQTTIQLFLGEKYYWRVRAIAPIVSQWSDVWTFTTPLGPASSKPVITYPGAQDSHYDIPLKPTLTWTSTVECTGYELIVAKQCDWANPLINLTGSSALGTDTCYTITQSLQEDTNYCWKVRAVNDDTGTASPWSDTGTFTTLVTEIVEEEGTPMWVWVVIALSAVLLVGVVVLIIRTRRPV